MSETDFHVGPFACQNLSLIVRGQRLHEADAVPQDVFRRSVWDREAETKALRPAPEIKPTADTMLQRIYSAWEQGLAERRRIVQQ